MKPEKRSQQSTDLCWRSRTVSSSRPWREYCRQRTADRGQTVCLGLWETWSTRPLRSSPRTWPLVTSSGLALVCLEQTFLYWNRHIQVKHELSISMDSRSSMRNILGVPYKPPPLPTFCRPEQWSLGRCKERLWIPGLRPQVKKRPMVIKETEEKSSIRY